MIDDIVAGVREVSTIAITPAIALTEMRHPISTWGLEQISNNSVADALPFLRALRTLQSNLLT